MSESPIDKPDPLLAALRELPPHAMDPGPETRLQRQARAAYLRGFEDTSWTASASSAFGRAAVPIFLACVVGLYMTWAIAAATSLVQ